MSALQFETPENVSVNFSPAGLGTRFIAWFVDQIFIWLFTIVLLIGLIIIGASFAGLEQYFDDIDPDNNDSVMIFVGIITLVWGLGSFVYFGAFELLMRGQTPGKRMSKIRVVKSDGFSLDASGIVVRNIFRVVDHIPLLWVVPLLSAKAQRAGDMVAGTVVVSEEQDELSDIRTELAERSALESEFRFQPSELKKLSDVDLRAIDQLLGRWSTLPSQQREMLLENMTRKIVARLNLEEPEVARRLKFMEDLLAAELRRQHQGLG